MRKRRRTIDAWVNSSLGIISEDIVGAVIGVEWFRV